MKKILTIIFACICVMQASAQKSDFVPEKHTHLYAVKGADSLYLDHYIAPVEGKRPCVMFVFGGGFVRGQRDIERDIPYYHFLARNGYDVVSIDYRLGMKGVSSPGMFEFLRHFDKTINIAVEDLFSATNFILDNADEWQIDPSQIVVSGSSAGAITALQAEYIISNQRNGVEILKEGFNYAGIIAFAGAVFTLDGKPKWKNPTAPMLLFHGSSDTQVPYKKVSMFGMGMYGSKYIADKLKKAGNPYWLYTVEYDTHSMAGKPMHFQQKEILIFLEEYVAQRRNLQRTTFTLDGAIPKAKTHFLPTDFIKSNY